MTHYSWQPPEENDLPCDCIMHRYNTVYLCGCGQLISHSQGDWNDHRLHPNGINIPSEYYHHGDTAQTLFDRLQVYGCLPYGTPGYNAVYDAISEAQ